LRIHLPAVQKLATLRRRTVGQGEIPFSWKQLVTGTAAPDGSKPDPCSACTDCSGGSF
jgi:hypothetical protein